MKTICFLFLLVLIPCSLFAQAFIHIPAAIEQGEPLLLLVTWEEPKEGILVRLTDPDGRIVASARSFPVPLSGNAGLYAGLLGIPSTAQPGSYQVLLSETLAESKIILEKEVTVRAREFLKEDISLTYALSELRQSKDPKKIEEALEMRRLLKQVNPESFYDPGKHRVPIDEYRVTSSFGDRRKYLYTDKGEASAIHNGMDLAAPVGTDVFACAAGKVVFAGERIITGKTVVVEHLPGFYSLYYHLDSILVKKGVLIGQGITIGTVGMTGLATGPHLHWELRAAGVAVNPNTFLERPLIDKESIISMIDGKL